METPGTLPVLTNWDTIHTMLKTQHLVMVHTQPTQKVLLVELQLGIVMNMVTAMDQTILQPMKDTSTISGKH